MIPTGTFRKRKYAMMFCLQRFSICLNETSNNAAGSKANNESYCLQSDAKQRPLVPDFGGLSHVSLQRKAIIL